VSVVADDGSVLAERIVTDSWYDAIGSMNGQADLADMQAFVDKFGTDQPTIEEVDEVPFADSGLRQDPKVMKVNKAIAQAFNEFGFKSSRTESSCRTGEKG
jgi:hypothetical protein